MNKIAFISGATSGIGKACAERLALENFHLILTGRRKERLEELKSQLEKEYSIKILTLCFDIQDRTSVFDNLQKLPLEWQKINVLINNAGLSLGRDSFTDADINDWEIMLQTNVNGLLYVTKALIPFLDPADAQIINVGSIAGKEVYENGNIYCASKFAVDAISKSMRIDLLKKGIKVTGIHPGAVETEFSLIRYKGDQAKADAVYIGFEPLSGKDIADAIYYIISLPKHVCINEIIITPAQQASTYYFNKNN